MAEKVLVCPLNWGLGHATRCVPVIREQLAAGNEVVLCADGYPLEFLRQEFPGLRTIELPSYPIRYSKRKSQVMAMILFLPKLLKGIYAEHNWLDNLLKTEHFDLVVSDNRFGMWNKNVRSIYITHQVMVKMPKGLKWLEPVGYRLHKYLIQKYNQCWIPDFAEFEGLSGDLSHKYPLPANAAFIGIHSRFPEAKCIQPDTTYENVVILSGPEPQRTMLENEMLDKFRYSSEKTIIIQGKPEITEHESQPDKITVVSHVPTEKLAAMLLGCKNIVARSGYSTIMDFYRLNILHKAEFHPTPGQTEQEYLLQHLRNKGLVK